MEKAISATAPEMPGQELLKGTIRKVTEISTRTGNKMAAFQVGEYTCKAFGKAAEKLLTMEGQTVEMCGAWQPHRLNKDIEEFVTDGRYVGKAFSSVPNETIPATPVPERF